jgi:hypothetical protein
LIDKFYFSLIAEQTGLTIVRRSSQKQRQLCDQSPLDNQLEPFSPDCQQQLDSDFSDLCLDNRLENMQPTNLSDDLDSVDLTFNTENLPAVDTPDACDKAAIRWVFQSRVIRSHKQIYKTDFLIIIFEPLQI